MVEFEAVELFLQASDRFAVRVHFGIMASRFLHDLVDDESRITSDFEPFDPELDCDVESVDEGLVLGCVV